MLSFALLLCGPVDSGACLWMQASASSCQLLIQLDYSMQFHSDQGKPDTVLRGLQSPDCTLLLMFCLWQVCCCPVAQLPCSSATGPF